MDEVALARELGLEILVTDHHQAETGQLPDCPILHPELSGYPFPSLCGAAVAAKLGSWLRSEAGEGAAGDEKDLDLVALATVADVMPLIGENRRLVREGIEVARRARRPGMAALLEECRVAAGQLVAEDFGFRLGPRINAAGRMYRADAGVELFLSESPERASEIARELSSANAERRRVEREVLAAAEEKLDGLDESDAAIVVASEGWHPGVVGIVASRLVRKYGRPSVVISLDGERGRGSARSVPDLDLHACLGEVSDQLLGFGGHAAAAGLQIETARIETFRQALGATVQARIGTGTAAVRPRFDVVAGGEELGLDLAEELTKLGPFGNGNPSVSILIPGALVVDEREMGEGRHCRFTVVSGANRAAGVSFGRGSLGVGEGERVDLLAELGLNHWNGAVQPRLVVREVAALPEAEPLPGCEEQEWWTRFEAALAVTGADDVPDPPTEGTGREPEAESRTRIEWSGLPGVRIGELIGSGARVAILTADAGRRWKALGGRGGLGRFRPEAEIAGLWEGSPAAAFEPALGRATVLVSDYVTTARAGLPDRFDEVVLLDPPPGPAELAEAARGSGRLHLVAGADEHEFALAAASHRGDPTADLRDLYRELRSRGAVDDGAGLSAGDLREVLGGTGENRRSPERAALLVRVLEESDLLRGSGHGVDRVLGVVSSVKVELSTSTVFGRHLDRHKEQIEFLRQSQKMI